MEGVIAEQPADQELHVILGNYSTHKHNQEWLKQFDFHFTPTPASWLNQVEIVFSMLQRKALTGASFSEVTSAGTTNKRNPFAGANARSKAASSEIPLSTYALKHCAGPYCRNPPRGTPEPPAPRQTASNRNPNLGSTCISRHPRTTQLIDPQIPRPQVIQRVRVLRRQRPFAPYTHLQPTVGQWRISFPVDCFQIRYCTRLGVLRPSHQNEERLAVQ